MGRDGREGREAEKRGREKKMCGEGR